MAGSQPIARSLLQASIDLRRVLRQFHEPGTADETLTPTQAELVSDVLAHPGTSIKESAARLRVAQNTVSTLVRQLVGRQILERRQSSGDARSASLHIAPGRDERRRRRADQRTLVLARAVDRLAADDRAALERAMPVIEALVEQVRDQPAPVSRARRARRSDSGLDDFA